MIYHAVKEADLHDLQAIGQDTSPETRPAANSEIDPVARGAAIRSLIRSGQIRFGGNKTLKIYGTLSCSSGKRMKVKNRVFFESEAEAQQAGYRPCGHCMQEKYKLWATARDKFISS